MGHILELPVGPVLVTCFLLAPHPILVEIRCPSNTWGLPNGRKEGSGQAPRTVLLQTCALSLTRYSYTNKMAALSLSSSLELHHSWETTTPCLK